LHLRVDAALQKTRFVLLALNVSAKTRLAIAPLRIHHVLFIVHHSPWWPRRDRRSLTVPCVPRRSLETKESSPWVVYPKRRV
jgi:hypothetical protein